MTSSAPLTLDRNTDMLALLVIGSIRLLGFAFERDAEFLKVLSDLLKLGLMLTPILRQNPKGAVPIVRLDLERMPVEDELSAHTVGPPEEEASPCEVNAGNLGNAAAEPTV